MEEVRAVVRLAGPRVAVRVQLQLRLLVIHREHLRLGHAAPAHVTRHTRHGAVVLQKAPSEGL